MACDDFCLKWAVIIMAMTRVGRWTLWGGITFILKSMTERVSDHEWTRISVHFWISEPSTFTDRLLSAVLTIQFNIPSPVHFDSRSSTFDASQRLNVGDSVIELQNWTLSIVQNGRWSKFQNYFMVRTCYHHKKCWRIYQVVNFNFESLPCTATVTAITSTIILVFYPEFHTTDERLLLMISFNERI